MKEKRGVRSSWVHVKLTESERSGWHEKAKMEGVTLSDLIRNRMSKEARPRRGSVDPALVRAVANAGNNLNQIARALNSRERVSVAEILSVLVAAERRLHEILERCTLNS